MELLLSLGADARAVNVEGKTPLLVAAESGADQSAALLIACGESDLDAADNRFQCAAIHWAACVELARAVLFVVVARGFL